MSLTDNASQQPPPIAAVRQLGQLSRITLMDEIQGVVMKAEGSALVLNVTDHANRLFGAYSAAGFSVELITDELIMEAVSRKIPIFFGRS